MSDAAGAAAPLRVAVAGASGRMGRMLIDATLGSPDCRLAAALDVPGAAALGRDAATLAERHAGAPSGVVVGADVDAALAAADVLIDFTRPDGTLAHLQACRRHGCAAVIGTTGFDDAQRAEIAARARELRVVLSANMAVGVNVVLGLVERAARALGDGWDIEIVEAHHRHKVDAPSGTALALGEAAARGVGRTLADCAVRARDGVTGERDPAAIGFAVVRGGDIVGDHTVLYAGSGERVEIVHRAASRAIYAQGALRAARFLAAPGRAPGLYAMADVLGLR